MQFVLFTLVVLLALMVTVSAFRGGHGRPLYGIIGDVQSVEGSLPLRGFVNYGGRGAVRYSDQW